VRRDYRTIEQWAPKYQGMSVVVVCHKGQKLSEGTAAWLRHTGIEAQTLEGGFEAWKKAGELLVRTDKLPGTRCAGPHGLGDAHAPESRPYRLSLVDSPLHRPARSFLVCGAF
jgi:3-mercaptopyruvate sulfurtransferase SseA